MTDAKYQCGNAANGSNEHDDRDDNGGRRAGAGSTSKRIEPIHLDQDSVLCFLARQSNFDASLKKRERVGASPRAA